MLVPIAVYIGELALEDLPDRHPGMARLLLYLPDALAVNPVCRPDYSSDPSLSPFPSGTVGLVRPTYQRSFGGGHFSVIICRWVGQF
jgi:hypothetical protein